MWRRLLLVGLTAGMAVLSASAVLADGLAGVWLTAGSESQIEIAPCGDAYCGRVLAVFKPADPKNPEGKDINNPNPALRNQTVVGSTILWNLKPGGDANVWEGSVYNPEDGRVYAVTLTLKGDKLEVEGCMALVLCDSQMWTRVQPPSESGPLSLQPQAPAPQ